MQGFSKFFASRQSEREASGDRRPSIEERYVSREAYLEQVREVAQQLVAEGYVLEEDVEIVVSACAARYDAATKPSQEPG
ncbi:MAG: alpha/beta hydrolase domain-containing protein [bacterium]|nr:alpha/beta hydrolase domain-containing protein [bacterium]